MTTDELLTAGQAAPILGLSSRSVSRLAKDGTLPIADRLPVANGVYLFRRADVEALRDELAAKAAS